MTDDDDDDEISEEGKRARFARWEEFGVERIKADLLAGGHQLVGGPPAVRKLAGTWVRMKEAEQRELVTLKPTFVGFTIDLKRGLAMDRSSLQRLTTTQLIGIPGPVVGTRAAPFGSRINA